MPDFAHLIQQYGYLALYLGSITEGETVTLLGGIAAHQQLLYLPWVIAVVSAGGTTGDQILYFIGRKVGPAALKRFRVKESQVARLHHLFERHPILIVIGVRFMYGFRIIGPIIIGSSKLPPRLFVPLNILGAILWATTFSLLGYFGGQIISEAITKPENRLLAGGVVITLIMLILGIRYYRRRK